MQKFMQRFFPDTYIDDIYSIDFDSLKKEGYTNLLFDLDNTIAPFDIEYPDENVKKFFKELEQKGFLACLISNNSGDRVEKFNAELNLAYIYKAGKPKTHKIKKLMEEKNMLPSNTAIVGDQLFTDMWVGSKIGLRKILVKPIADRDEFTVKLKRGLEKQVFKLYLKDNPQIK